MYKVLLASAIMIAGSLALPAVALAGAPEDAAPGLGMTPGILYVPSAQFASIQAALTAASDGDTIIVDVGVYYENIYLDGKNITLSSTDPTDPDVVAQTVIDGRQRGPVVTFAGTETAECVLEGFTIRNGYAMQGGGIQGTYGWGYGLRTATQATVRYNRIENNRATERGGGLCSCDGLIEKNIIANNEAVGPAEGGGLALCGGLIRNNLIYGNTAAWGGGAFSCGTLQNNTIYGNAALSEPGGGIVAGSIRNCIIWGNTAPGNPQVDFFDELPSHSCIQGWGGLGEGNISLDPRLVDAANGDLRLDAESPCIDTGTSLGAPDTDIADVPRPQGAGVDMGAYEYLGEGAALTVSPKSLDIAADGETATFSISYAGPEMLSWTASITDGAQWLSVAPTSGTGDTIATVYVMPNTSVAPRASTIQIEAPGIPGSPVDVTVSQAAGAGPSLVVWPTNVVVGDGGDVEYVEITYDGPEPLAWTATVTSGLSWLSTSPESGTGDSTVSLLVERNTSASWRRGTVRIDAYGLQGSPVTVTVDQVTGTRPRLNVTPSELDAYSGGDSRSVAITNMGSGILAWTASVMSGADWLTLSALSGTGDATLTVNAAPNNTGQERTGTIRVDAPGVEGSPADIAVTQPSQDKPILLVSPTDLGVVPASGATTSVRIDNAGSGTFSWAASVTSGTGWLSVTPISAAGERTLTVSVAVNTSPGYRTGTIRIAAAGVEGSPVDVTVAQLGDTTPELAVSPTEIEAPAAGGTPEVIIANAGNGSLTWTATVTSGATWLAASPFSGTDEGTLTLTITPNTATTPRTGVIHIEADDVQGSPVDVTVTQQGDVSPKLSVTPTNQSVAGSAGNTTFAVANTGHGTMPWTAVVADGGSWLTIVSGDRGQDDGEILLAYSENPAVDIRTGTVRVDALDAAGSPAEVTITQMGAPMAEMTVGQTAVTTDYRAGAAPSIAIRNIGGGTLVWTASVVAGLDWLSVSPDVETTGDGEVVISFAENASPEPRTGIVVVAAPEALGSPVEIVLTQTGRQPVLVVTPASQTAGAAAGTASFAVQDAHGGSLTWSASVTQGKTWFAISTSGSGTETGSILATFQKNLSGRERTAIIRVTADGAAGSPKEVTVTQAAGTPLSADFSANKTSGPAPLIVAFEDGSTPGTASIATWLWDFGDGATSDLQNPTHTYFVPGTYTVTLTVSSTLEGDIDTIVRKNCITVTPIGCAGGSLAKGAPRGPFNTGVTGDVVVLGLAATVLMTAKRRGFGTRQG